MQVFFKAKAKARIFEAKAIKIRCQGASVVSADIIISGNFPYIYNSGSKSQIS